MRYHYSTALWWNTRYRDAAAIQRDVFQMADRLGDSRSKAYSLIGEISTSVMLATKSLGEFEILKSKQSVPLQILKMRTFKTGHGRQLAGITLLMHCPPHSSWTLLSEPRRASSHAAATTMFRWSTTFE
jgi:hypothetical protein